MKSPGDKNLLNDVLSESEPADFRETLLNETLRLVQQRRRNRRLWQASPVLLIGALVLYLLPRHTVTEKPARSPVEVVATQPLNPAAIVRTTPLAEESTVLSKPGVLIVHTKPGCFRLIGDAELLALAAPRSAVLIQLAPDSQALIFINPENTTGQRPN